MRVEVQEPEVCQDDLAALLAAVSRDALSEGFDDKPQHSGDSLARETPRI